MNADNNTSLVDEHLDSLDQLADVDTKPFFYSRLRNKMYQKRPQGAAQRTFNPVYVICALFVFLMLNIYMIRDQRDYIQTQPKPQANTLSAFASEYNLTVSSY